MAKTSQSKRTAGAAQALLYSLIVIAILGAVNYLANRYNKSFDSTANKLFTLSDQTAKIAREAKQPISITYWDQPDNYPIAKGMLDRYQSLSPNIKIAYKDIDKDRIEAIAAGVQQTGAVIVQVGNKTQQAKTLQEEDITGAITKVLKGGDRMVCFTSGYGEHDLTNMMPDGYASLKTLTEKNNYKTEVVAMIPSPVIPKECTLLVVGGPRRDYMQPALDAIKGFADGGGRILVMLDPPLKLGAEVDDNEALTSLLATWGVTLNKDVVFDLSGASRVPQLPIINRYGQHAVVRSMRNTATAFPIVRSLEVSKSATASAEPLVTTTGRTVVTNDMRSAKGKVDESKQAPRTLAAAGSDTSTKDRFVVVGTSQWVSNEFVSFVGNRDLYLNMINWLSADEDLIALRPKDPEDRRLNMNQNQLTLMFYSSVIALPLLMLFAGVSVWWRRR